MRCITKRAGSGRRLLLESGSGALLRGGCRVLSWGGSLGGFSQAFLLHQPCLHLKRDGAPCGAIIKLANRNLVLGRYSPWTGPVDVDLNDLPDAALVR